MALTPEQIHDMKVAAANAAPGVASSVAAQTEGVTGADLITVATLMLILIQFLYYAWKWRRDVRRHDHERARWKQGDPDRRRRRRDRDADPQPCEVHSQFDNSCTACLEDTR